MNTVALIAASLAALLHVAIFYIEALAFTQPETYRRFMVSEEAVEFVRPWAFNQGFYNLFLGIGTAIGVSLWGWDHSVARALICFGCACMLGAAIVLVASDRRMARAAITQGLLPLLALATIW
jgi:putative membrane protein